MTRQQLVDWLSDLVPRLLGSTFAGAAAFFLAIGVGLPVWRWGAVGDASDVASFVWFACFFLTARRP